jgi:transcriptional regulator GlxA family with amidase domain
LRSLEPVQHRAMTKHIAFVGYDNVTTLDLFGPLEVFATANDALGSKVYQLSTVCVSGKVFAGESGVRVAADVAFRDAPAFDTIIVPGGCGLRDPEIGDPVVAFLKARLRSTRRIVSVCTGLEALAQAGFMNGRRATTHWRFAAAIAKKFPQIKLDIDAIYIRDGKFYTSAGVTAGIDLALALVGEDHGEKLALRIAREMVVYLKRAGGQGQFSEPLQFQTRAGDGFADLAQWMLRNLGKDLSAPALAARVHLGVRHFSRRFKQSFGLTPAAYVERLRLDEARKRLPMKKHNIKSVAASLGYASADAFGRAFERRFGIRPSHYERQFS